jgi:predicted dehydrogenase
VIRWGFLGAGGIARTALAPAVHAADGAVLQSAAARDSLRAEGLGPVRVLSSYQEVVEADDVDAVYIALANDQHLPWSLAALRAGKHVLCEKPLCLTAAEIDVLLAAAGDRICVEASWYRWHPRVRLAQQHLPEIGPVRHVSAGFTFGNVPDGNYRLDPAMGGGALYDVGCYAVSACLWAVREGVPSDVSAQLRLGPTGVDLASRLDLRWPSGATAEVRASVDDSEGQWLVITGEHGEIALRDQPYASWREATLLDVSGRQIAVPAVDSYQVMVEEVSSVIAGGPGWVLPLAESRQTAEVLDRAFATTARETP